MKFVIKQNNDEDVLVAQMFVDEDGLNICLNNDVIAIVEPTGILRLLDLTTNLKEEGIQSDKDGFIKTRKEAL